MSSGRGGLLGYMEMVGDDGATATACNGDRTAFGVSGEKRQRRIDAGAGAPGQRAH